MDALRALGEFHFVFTFSAWTLFRRYSMSNQSLLLNPLYLCPRPGCSPSSSLLCGELFSIPVSPPPMQSGLEAVVRMRISQNQETKSVKAARKSPPRSSLSMLSCVLGCPPPTTPPPGAYVRGTVEPAGYCCIVGSQKTVSPASGRGRIHSLYSLCLLMVLLAIFLKLELFILCPLCSFRWKDIIISRSIQRAMGN